ncbi:Uncharacterised protein [Mycobacteroides abscessus subsp. abscessus]|nr:Uncharacterised protein [Mycobacteroides abscessus subsp. abscessus]
MSAELVSPKNPRTSVRAWLSAPRVAPRFSVLAASTLDTDARWVLNCTICSLEFANASTRVCRFLIVPNRSVRESPSLPAAWESSRTALRKESPLPSKVVAAWLMKSLTGPLDCPCGPRLSLSLASSVLTSSHSIGTAVLSSPSEAPSCSALPSV